MRKLKLPSLLCEDAFKQGTKNRQPESVGLGKVKTEQIKRLGKELIERYPEKFSKSFEENKHAVVELTKGTTSRIRNQIAGYITSQCAPEEETEASGEDLTDEVEAPA
jgi:small subunit ribosomal protein S17e